MTQVVSSYQLGPISAGADSPLGGLFGFFAGISSNYDTGFTQARQNYATGLNAIVNAPTSASKVLTGAPLVPADVQALNAAQHTGLSPNPFIQVGQVGGGLLGTGLNAIGVSAGAGLKTAGAPIGSGLGAAVQGGGQGFGLGAIAAGPGVGTGVGAAISGGFQGLGSALGNVLGGAGSVGSGNTFLLLAGGLILILLFLTL